MLTAMGGVPDRLKGFEFGEDYYIPKPFAADEVMAAKGDNEKTESADTRGIGSADRKLKA
ncbi:hypothetical protein [Jeotgalibacillus soli]|nr:hypothetical protein [Jeotgalibacillus soli]